MISTNKKEKSGGKADRIGRTQRKDSLLCMVGVGVGTFERGGGDAERLQDDRIIWGVAWPRPSGPPDRKGAAASSEDGKEPLRNRWQADSNDIKTAHAAAPSG